MRTHFGRFFCVAVFALLSSASARADLVTYMPLPQLSLARFMALASSSESSIDIANFIFEPCDPSTQILMEILRKRTQAGVKVRVLLDNIAQSGQQKQNIINYFSQNGIAIRFYNDTVIGIELRMHIKLMLVDGHSYIAGGRNLSDEYFALSSSLNYVDRDVFVTGSSAVEAGKSFAELWNSDMTETNLISNGPFSTWDQVCSQDSRARVAEVRDYLSQNSASILAEQPARFCQKVRFVTDNPDFANPIYGDNIAEFMSPDRLVQKRATLRALKFLKEVKSSLHVENWSYMPIDYLERAFAELRGRNVEIKAATNQDMDSDIDFFRQAEEYSTETISLRDSIGTQAVQRLSSWGKLATPFALTPPGGQFFIHAKVLLRDQKDVIVGSFNLDPRSYNTNLEAAVEIKDCPDLASDVQKGFAQLQKAQADDIALGQVPPQESYSLFAITFADMNLEQF